MAKISSKSFAELCYGCSSTDHDYHEYDNRELKSNNSFEPWITNIQNNRTDIERHETKLQDLEKKLENLTERIHQLELENAVLKHSRII